MSNTENNRQIVQEGLNRKKVARNQRMTDAAHDAAERKLRAVINQETQKRRDATEEEQAKAEQDRQREERRKAHRVQEKKEVKQFTDFALHVCGGLCFAALCCFGFIHDAMAGWLAMTCIALATIYCIAIFTKYAIRTLKRERAAA